MDAYILWLYMHVITCLFINALRPNNSYIYNIIIIGSDNGLLPGRSVIIWTNAGMQLNGLLGINISEFYIQMNTFSFWKCRLQNGAYFVSA